MISLKRYLDSTFADDELPDEKVVSTPCEPLLAAYRSALTQIGEFGAETCPAHGAELKRGVAKIDSGMGLHPTSAEIALAEQSVSELLLGWGKKAAQHYLHRTSEVKDLLLVMTRTAESLGHKDELYSQQLESATAKLDTIARLEDVTRIRASIEESARDLRNSVNRMIGEGRAVVEHLRAEVLACQAKLEKAEHIASCDSLTGLGSRFWIERRIDQRVESHLPFSILVIDIDGFRRLNEEHGKFVGDQLLKEFSRELRSTCRISDLVARWGGDRFIVVVDSVESEAQSQVMRLRNSISKQYHVPGRTGYLSVPMAASIVIVERRDGDCLNDLLECADMELMRQRAATRERLSA
jgi:diguanylate cyclase (GGDEF)-like protein